MGRWPVKRTPTLKLQPNLDPAKSPVVTRHNAHSGSEYCRNNPHLNYLHTSRKESRARTREGVDRSLPLQARARATDDLAPPACAWVPCWWPGRCYAMAHVKVTLAWALVPGYSQGTATCRGRGPRRHPNRSRPARRSRCQLRPQRRPPRADRGRGAETCLRTGGGRSGLWPDPVRPRYRGPAAIHPRAAIAGSLMRSACEHRVGRAGCRWAGGSARPPAASRNSGHAAARTHPPPAPPGRRSPPGRVTPG